MSEYSKVNVYSLETGKYISSFQNETLKGAALKCYDRSLDDHDATNYETKYSDQLSIGETTVACGEFCAVAA